MGRAEGTLGLTRRKLLELRSEMAAIRLRLALRAFDPNQPRWPAGRTDGGQWRQASRGNATRVAAFEEGRRMQCDLQRELDEELCAMQLDSWCWDSAAERWNNCMRGVYIPPLKVGKR